MFKLLVLCVFQSCRTETETPDIKNVIFVSLIAY